MFKSKKMVIAGTLCALTAALSFAQEVSFENKLSSDIVNISITEDETGSAFAGFENETTAEFTSDKLDFGLTLKFNLANADDNSFAIGNENFVDDYFIEFRPIDLLGIGFHKKYSIAGSYLPCLDAEIEAANIGSDFGLFVRPLKGLVIAGGLDFISYFGKDDAQPVFNAGAEYTLEETIAFGAAVRNIASDDRSFGVYTSFTGVENFTFNAAFTYNGVIEDFNISGNLINAAFIYTNNSLSIFADAVFAAGGDEDEANELYTAASVTYQITDPFSANVCVSFSNDFDNDDAWAIKIKPAAEYAISEHNTLGAALLFDITKEETDISFPVFWKYVF